MSKKNDWRVVYSLIYNVSQSKIEWKMSKKNEVKTIYNSIYYDSQSKIEWKMNKKNDWRVYSLIYYSSVKKWVRKMS